jgi:hypothetical protein
MGKGHCSEKGRNGLKSNETKERQIQKEREREKERKRGQLSLEIICLWG